jgi:hypothetical protein
MADDRDFEEVRLELARDACNLEAVLPPPEYQDMGGETVPEEPPIPDEIRSVCVTLRVGRRPLVVDLAALPQRAVAGEAAPGSRPPRLCLVLVSVAALGDGIEESLRQVGLTVELPEDKKGIRIFDLFPKPEYIRQFGADLSCHFDLSGAQPADAGGSTDASPGVKDAGVLGLRTQLSCSIDGQLSFGVYTQVVDAVGVGDYRGQWVLTRQKEPLAGRDHLFGLVVSVPTAQRTLAFKVKVHAVVTYWTTLYTFPIRLEQKGWTSLSTRILTELPSEWRGAS